MKTGSLVITMSTYSAHKGGSGAYVGLDTAHATHMLLELEVVAGHLELEGLGGGHLQPEGVGVEEVVAGHPELERAGEVVGHLELEGVGRHYHPEVEVVAGHLQVLGHLFPI